MSPSVKAGCPFAVDDRGAGMRLSIVIAGLERGFDRRTPKLETPMLTNVTTMATATVVLE